VKRYAIGFGPDEAIGSQLERTASTRDGVPFRIRPIRATDEKLDREFIMRLSPESRYRRMMNAMLQPSAELLYRFVHVDYDRDMAFAALVGDPPDEQIIGIARYAHDPTGSDCEFAVAVADAWQKRGVGATLMQYLLEYAHARGIREVHGEILADNQRMIELARWLGMKLRYHPQGAAFVEATRKT
jgi:acetyltransferase